VSFAHGERVALQMMGVLRDAGYEVDRTFRPLHLQPKYAHYARGPLPRAEREWSAIIELPCEPGVPVNDIRRIAALIRAGLATS
jgi:dTDP-4-amino-4,6-dideoxygalactose transaminase